MPQSIHATFRSTSWEETPIGEGGTLPKLTRASSRQVYTGDVAGDSTLEYLMVYRDGGAATFVGVERIEGTVNQRAGSFALRHEGVFEDGVARMVGMDELALSPGATVEFAPGGKHLMLMRPGDDLDLVTLEFFAGDTVVLTVNVASSE